MKKALFLLLTLSFTCLLLAQQRHAPVPFRSCTKWGFVEYGTKKKVVNFEYDTVGVFSGGRAWVKKGDLYGYVDEKGGLVIPIQYDKVHDFVYGQAYVVKAEKKFCINKTGEEISPRWMCGNSFMGDTPPFYAEKIGNQYTLKLSDYYDNKEETPELLPVMLYDSLLPSMKAVFALKNGKWRLINEKNEVLADFVWEKIHLLQNTYMYDYSYEYFAVSQGGKWAIADAEGKLLTPYKYEAIGKRIDDLNATTTAKPFDGEWGFIDMKGTEYFEERGEGCLNERIDFAQEMALSANPNPFVEEITVSFSLAKEAKTVKISLTDISGKIVYEEILQDYPQGKHEYTLNIKGISVGVYVLHVDSKAGGAAVRVQKF